MYRLPRALTLRHQLPTPLPALRPRPQLLRAPRIQRRYKSQILYNADGEQLRYQAVRFKKPGFSMRRVVTWGLYTGVVYAYLSLILRQLDVEIEFVEDEEDASQTKEQEDEAARRAETEVIEGPLYADEASTFVPLTWSKPLPRTFYRGSDPEWQEFVKIAKNPTVHKKIQEELVNIVFTGCSHHPHISRQLGDNLKIGKHWLDISFPDGPPQEYERKGIEIGEGYVAWSLQKVDQEKQWRTQRALVPKAAAEGTWRALKTLVGIQWRRVKRGLGWEGVDPMAPEERWKMLAEMQRQAQQQKEGGAGQVGKAQTEPNARVEAAKSGTQAQQSQPQRREQADRKDALPWYTPTIPLPTTANPFSSSTTSSTSDSNSSTSVPALPNPSLPIAMHVFSSSLSKNWNPKKSEPPRGAFIVQGLVEIRGSKGRMLFDVVSSYDPKGGSEDTGGSAGGAAGVVGGGLGTDRSSGSAGSGGTRGRFVKVDAGVRGYKRWRQSPRGGP